jgi:GNAT superfamily N-acetyltransferase
LKIREADLNDAAALAALSIQLGYPSTPGEMVERLTVLGSRPGNGVLVAEDEKGVVGWLHVSGMFFLESPPFAEVLGLIVDEAHRGKGVGRLLLDGAARWAAEHGFGKLRVRSNVIREDAHRFYEREGFRRVKTQVVLDRTL